MKVKKYTVDLGITNSLLSKWVDCRVAGQNYLQTWLTKGYKKALNIGSMFHDLKDTVNKEIFVNWRTTNAVLDIVIEERASFLIDQELKKSSSATTLQQIEDDAYLAIAMIKEYVRYYRVEDVRKYKLIGSEQEFDISWEGFRWRGAIDTLLQNKKSKSYCFMETKTFSKQNDEEKAQLLEFDFQTLMYRHFASLHLRKEVDSVIYDMVRKPQLRQGKNEGRDEFLQRCRNDMKDRPEHYFVRFNVTFDPIHIEQHRFELLEKAKEFQMWSEGKLATYKNEKSCKKT